jgi:2,4-dienoyl-CoA reductase-like NADH-dependent reductase (Old Yellow Enzyme family)
MTEATAVSPQGRITAGDTGLWQDSQMHAFSRIAEFIKGQNCVAGIQLAHAGRKASTRPPWQGRAVLKESEGGWRPEAPSGLPFDDNSPSPGEMGVADLDRVESEFVRAAELSLKAGFQVVELHMAHGYLLHQFLSPLSNRRSDDYGGGFEARIRFPLRVARAVRRAWPSALPLFVRISATDWIDGGWDLQQSLDFSRRLKDEGVDLIDCSSGGIAPGAAIPMEPGYQVRFASEIRKQAGVATGAVGLITGAPQAEAILQNGDADAIFLGRELLRRPYWPLHAALELGEHVSWPLQYERGRPVSE